MQYNRDQLKLLKDGVINQAELFVLDRNVFKKVTIIPFTGEKGEGFLMPGEVVAFLYNRGKGSRIRTGVFIEKDGFKVDEEPGRHINPDHIFGIVTKEEILYISESNTK